MFFSIYPSDTALTLADPTPLGYARTAVAIDAAVHDRIKPGSESDFNSAFAIR
jgi:hypothetical protein